MVPTLPTQDMFGSSTLSLPSPFASEHHPLRPSSDTTRPQPSGGCNFLLVQPSAKSKICACQVYHHNRSAPGNVCDCGHPACFHVHTFGDKAVDGAHGLKIDTADKIKKLEDMIVAERQARESDRMEWQREVRTIREALTPFYRTEAEMQRRLAQMELNMNTAVDEQKRCSEQVQNLSKHNHTSHKDAESAKMNSNLHARMRTSTSQAAEDVPGLTSSDDRSSASSFSRHHTPSEALPTVIEPDSPRSSGILNLVSHPRPSVTPTYNVSRPPPQAQEEPRSSGFLGVDMRQRFPATMAPKRRRLSPTSSTWTDSTEYGLPRPHTTTSPRFELSQSHLNSTTQSTSSTVSPGQSTSSRSLPRPMTPPSNYVDQSQPYQDTTRGATWRGHTSNSSVSTASSNVPFMALDVLANVSTASNGLR